MQEKPVWGSLLLFASTSHTVFQRKFFTLVCHQKSSALLPSISSVASLLVCKSCKAYYGYCWALPAQLASCWKHKQKIFWLSQLRFWYNVSSDRWRCLGEQTPLQSHHLKSAPPSRGGCKWARMLPGRVMGWPGDAHLSWLHPVGAISEPQILLLQQVRSTAVVVPTAQCQLQHPSDALTALWWISTKGLPDYLSVLFTLEFKLLLSTTYRNRFHVFSRTQNRIRLTHLQTPRPSTITPYGAQPDHLTGYLWQPPLRKLSATRKYSVWHGLR